MDTSITIIGFSGKIGSGKDYVAKHIFLPILQEKIGANPLFLSFADPLKQECALRYGCSYEKLYKDKDVFTRTKLQEVGSKIRNKYGTSVFVRAMEMAIKLHHERSNINFFIIPDVRFPEEMNFIRENNGKVYRVIAKGRTYDKLHKECKGNEKEMKARSNHESETALDDQSFDWHIYNDYGSNPTDTCQLLIGKIISNS